MKTVFVLCLIFSIAAGSSQFALANKINKHTPAYPADTVNNGTNDTPQTDSGVISQNSPQQCKGNGIVTFVNSSPEPLWFYYWYAEDVNNASHEDRIRRFWKQLDAGNNLFTIPENKTLIFRICTSTEYLNNVIKQYGIVYYCNTINGVIFVK